ncbi:MAG: argininosuccinate synthase [Deltaproteobacteria bacterium]|nr:MAG: argininosuccinate synthase [Deltaproteobacteria bacterium]
MTRSRARARAAKAWAGRIAAPTAPAVERFTGSLPVDRRLYPHDIAGSVAHVRALVRARLLTRREGARLERGLGAVRRELDAGRFRFLPSDEDIHMAIERRLVQLLGPLGGKLHTGRRGNDQVRFELAYAALAPELTVIAPWREWEFKGRADLIAYAQAHRIPVAATAEKPYSTDRNLLHVSYEGGILEDPWRPPYDDMFQLTVAPERAPEQPEDVDVDLEGGVPVAVNGERLSPAALLARLNAIAGAHGVGRVDVVENRYVGMKSRGVYETPGGTVLRAAFQAVESLTLDREVMHLRDSLVPRYAEMVYYGYWFAPERLMLQAAVDEAARAVSGTARLRLYRGSVRTVGRKAPRSLYDPQLVSFDEAGGYRQEDAGGFIRLAGLRLRLRTLVEQTRK